MVSKEKLFGNHFDEKEITSTRLANFAADCINRFKAVAIEGEYATTINELTVAFDNLQAELSGVDTGLNKQKNKTLNLDEFITNFKNTMSNMEGALAFKAGKTSAVYMELYPEGVTEYRNALKGQMNTLMDRVQDVVTNHETALGTDLAALLSGLKTQWLTLINQQKQQKMKLADSRVDRSDARYQLEVALHRATHMLAETFPFDVDKCASFFDFTLLHGLKPHEEEEETEPAVEEQQ